MSVFSMSRAHERTAYNELIRAADKISAKKMHRQELLLLSCYVEPSVVLKLIMDVAKRIELCSVQLAFNMSEVYRLDPIKIKEALDAIEVSCKKKNIDFEWHALATSSEHGLRGLVHSKGYAIVQLIGDLITGGASLIGSANLTKSGFETGANVELGYSTTRLPDLESFVAVYDELVQNYRQDIDGAIFKQNLALFRYALFRAGKFLHKWDGNLRQMVGIRYDVINKERWAQLPPELSEDGFELSDTLTRQPLMLKALPKKEITGAFTKNFTVDTSLGRWCPEQVWRHVSERDSGPFINAFLEATKPEVLEVVVNTAAKRQTELIERKLIREVEADHLARWVEKINSLRENTSRLHRLYTGYVEFDLPFEPERISEINDLFDSLKETLESRSTDNWTTRKLRHCIKRRDLSALDVDERARELIKKCVKPTPADL